ncbi:MAG: class I SAM-dependent methyltransferase, partial [Myxococcota bacterium]|nr:class I SAM-dependent methyltransferase [Myxococcota bacterium]
PPAPLRTALDVGCGTGRFTELVREAFPRARIVGLDPAPGMLGRARAKGARAASALVRARGEALPVASDRVDLAVISMAYHHLEQPDAALAELARVLRPGGRVYLRTPTLETLHSNAWDGFFPEARARAEAPQPPTQDLRRTARTAGLDVLHHDTLRSVFARTDARLLERIASRSISSLRRIPDDAFARGLDALRAQLRTRPEDEPALEELAVFVLRRP